MYWYRKVQKSTLVNLLRKLPFYVRLFYDLMICVCFYFFQLHYHVIVTRISAVLTNDEQYVRRDDAIAYVIVPMDQMNMHVVCRNFGCLSVLD